MALYDDTNVGNGTRSPERTMIRLATSDDAPAMLEIYGPLVVETAVTFEFEPPTIEQFRERMQAIQARFPWLVFERDTRIAGFAYAGPHRMRPAYQWSVEVSVYVDPGFRRQGIARALYLKLFELLEVQGYKSAFAGITLPNDPSEALHRCVGFDLVGTYRAAGYKLGRWRDAIWYQRRIGDTLPDNPGAPLTPAEVSETEAWQAVLRSSKDRL